MLGWRRSSSPTRCRQLPRSRTTSGVLRRFGNLLRSRAAALATAASAVAGDAGLGVKSIAADKVSWVSFGSRTVCIAEKGDATNGDIVASNVTQKIALVSTLDRCKRHCEDIPCSGIAYRASTQECELWSRGLASHASAGAQGDECLVLVPRGSSSGRRLDAGNSGGFAISVQDSFLVQTKQRPKVDVTRPLSGPVPMLDVGTDGRTCSAFEKEWDSCPQLPSCTTCVPTNCIFSPWQEWTVTGDCAGICLRSRGIKMFNNACGAPCKGTTVESRECIFHSCVAVHQPRDCVLGQWSVWGDCASVLQQRSRGRMVETQPLRGGQPCDGEFLQETKPCGVTTPESCKFTTWGPWAPCRASCGGGSRFRSRAVKQRARNGGATCEGSLQMLDTCNTAPCEVNCLVSPWSSWSSCTLEGSVQKYRSRILLNNLCRLPVREISSCGKIVTPHPCQLSAWTAWSSCTVTCGRSQTYRKRSPVKLPEGGGSCPAAILEEAIPCDMGTCHLPSAYDCLFATWSDWGRCSATCNGGLRKRTRIIARLRTAVDAARCYGALEQLEGCSLMPCTPVDCVWGSWKEWSACIVSCGGGNRQRNRAVEVSPRNGGRSCETLVKMEIAPCGRGSCEVCVDGRWSHWSEWSKCSAGRCGDGFQTRSRGVDIQHNHCGKPASGLEDEYAKCRGPEGSCIVLKDCQLSGWSQWGQCSVTCFGARERRRAVVQHASGGGKSCANSSVSELEACNPAIGEHLSRDCSAGLPQPCVLSAWSVWSRCSTSCGGGNHNRMRRIISPSVANGRPCDTSLEEVRPCGTEPCGFEVCLDCSMGPWSAWSACAAPCGGERYRFRAIRDRPTPCGKPCNLLDVKEAATCPREAEKCGIVFCAWTAWPSFTPCTPSCFATQRVRLRQLSVFTSAAALGSLTPLFEGSSDVVCAAVQSEIDVCEPQQSEGCGLEFATRKLDCVFNTWQSWTSPTCTGLCERTRTVAQQGSNGGFLCVGALTETKRCEVNCVVPQDCLLSEWTQWSGCPTELSQRERGRSVLQPGENGGLPCSGQLRETVPCVDPFVMPPLNCSFSPWMPWRPCSTTCDGGVQQRSRVIGIRSNVDGHGCADRLEEVRGCQTQPCPRLPRPCTLGDWQEWSNCTTGDQRYRYRDIKQAAQDGGQPCVLASLGESSPCVLVVDCELSPWTSWGECDKPCGKGQQERHRVIAQSPVGDGMPCSGDLQQTRGCNPVVCSVLDCQIGAWSAWHACSASCGDGLQKRSRSVERFAEEGGEGCRDALVESRTCRAPPCVFRDCVWGGWSGWSTCSRTCDGGIQWRGREIVVSPLQGGKLCDPLAKEEVAPCNAHRCDKNCVDGIWGEWMDWEVCSRSCSGGITWRFRVVLKEATACGRPALGKNRQVASCNSLIPCFKTIDCEFRAWTPWASCTELCGGLTQRLRSVARHRLGAGSACEGPMVETRSCNAISQSKCNPAPSVDCVLSVWQDWSACSVSCGGGFRRRQRTVLVQPTFDGMPCASDLEVAGSCADEACPGESSCKPVDCLWGPWTEWMACDRCGGERRRVRAVLKLPSCEGQACDPRMADEVGSCPRACGSVSLCEWNSWEAWSSCSVTCGVGQRSRLRRMRVLSLNASQSSKILESRLIMRDVRNERWTVLWNSRRVRWLLAIFVLGALSGTASLAVMRGIARSRRTHARSHIIHMETDERDEEELTEVQPAPFTHLSDLRPSEFRPL
eukprot:TRINITY_DN38198_c0_g1_i1.p1 TRINITY_DN38198_c0_g1~~TRINITY_DN38198_c0_g1_i1.p1  ORF type:complete len:1721 (+),score=194.58 TRINITY_DN38198_c0_g1_i1:123-5285(+)